MAQESYLNIQNISRSRGGVEYHPLVPFLPANARVLFLGSFPPQRKRWCMDFYYPNFINDHWRIEGAVFFADRHHFVDEGQKCFRLDSIVDFCQERGIAFYDTLTAVRRLRDNASDKYLEEVEPTDVGTLVNRLPLLRTVVTTGEKATMTLCARLGLADVPKVGSMVCIPGRYNQEGSPIMLCRLPSSSRAYPLSFDKKVEAYRRMFAWAGMLEPAVPRLTHYALGSGVVAFSSTRHGGCSTGHYAEFNINQYCGDSEEHTAHNRKALCRLLSISYAQLLMPHQTHGTRVACIDEAFMALTADERQARLEGVDALMTRQRGICIGVSTADCIPILLYDKRLQAVCAIHAGWRGTVARIAGKAVEAMAATWGSHASDIVAQIGPGIRLDSFEVGQEVYDAFAQAGFDMPAVSRRYPSSRHPGEQQWHINLPECNRRQLLSCGLLSANISDCGICTCQHPDTYFSARRLGIRSGRIFTGIMIR